MNTSQPLRTCTTCGASYPVTPEYFHRTARGKDGLQSQCRTCLNNKKRLRRLAEKIASAKPADPIMHKTCSRCGRLFPASNKYFHRQSSAADGLHKWCRDCTQQYNQQYREQNLDKLREYDRARYAERRAATKRYHRQWQRENRKKVKAYHQRRRALLADAPGEHSAEDIKRQYDAQNGKCWYCLKPVGEDYHVDHVVPLSRNGTNNPGNIVIACPACNLSKGAKLPSEFIGRLF